MPAILSPQLSGSEKRMEALQALLATGIGGLGIGMGGNALLNANEAFEQPLSTVAPSASIPVTLPIRFGHRLREARRRTGRRNVVAAGGKMAAESLQPAIRGSGGAGKTPSGKPVHNLLSGNDRPTQPPVQKSAPGVTTTLQGGAKPPPSPSPSPSAASPGPLAKLAAAVAAKIALELPQPQDVADAVIPDIKNTSFTNESWGIPAMLAAGGTGLAGGWGLAQWLRTKNRKSQMQSELEGAETEFDDALLAQYEQALTKQADDPTHPMPELDRLAKKAADFGIPQVAKDLWGSSKGVLGALSLLAATGTGIAAYQATKSRDPQALLRKALRERSRQRSSPQGIYVVTPPRPVTQEAVV